VKVPWSGFDLINSFNAWKKSEDAGRVFIAAPDGTIVNQVTGLCWRQEVSAQVFEEAAVDLGHALAAYGGAGTSTRGNHRVGFPKQKRKGRCRDSFRLRNRTQKGGGHLIRVGEGHPRTVRLPRIGTVRVHEDTRRLRRLLRPVEQLHPDTGQRILVSRAKVLYATISRQGTRWFVSLNVQAPDLHPGRRHPRRPGGGHGGWIGIDRGLGVFAVAATAEGVVVGRFQSPKPLARRLGRLQRRSRAVSSTKEDPVIASRQSVDCPVSTPASPISAGASCTRSRASSPRPTPSWWSRISMSRDSSATPALPAPLGMPPGPTSVASSVTRPPGWMAN
jgi:putative transposase